MRVLVTGATGFIGRHVVTSLLAKGYSVIAVGRSQQRADILGWPKAVKFVVCDIHGCDLDITARFGVFDAAIHLAWPGLPNYKSLFHIESVLPAECRFLKALIMAGCKNLVVTGTCFEYGMQNGCLHEGLESRPENPYALAKDTLRRYLQALSVYESYSLKWARLFYMYGPGQSESSLIPQLELALARGDQEFFMSGGEQLRDYLPVECVALHLISLLEMQFEGVINVCSGQPVSVRRLVEEYLLSRDKNIVLRLGHYPYPDYEPFAFWGCDKKIKGLIHG